MKLRYSEADFVIAAPGHGFFVAEVKGGQISYRDGVFNQLQRGRWVAIDPLAQAHSALREIKTRFDELRIKCPPYEPLVIMPQWRDDLPTNDDLRGRFIGGYELDYLDEALPAILNQSKFLVTGKEGDDWIGVLDGLWGRSEAQALSLGKVGKWDGRASAEFDQEQLRCIDEMLVQNPRALVCGGAGTGKTWIAQEAARRMAAKGKRVLLVCFTEALGHWLRQELAPAGIEVWPVKRFGLHLLELADSPLTAPEQRRDWTPDFWQSVIPRALSQAADVIANYAIDVLIVDEAQDFDSDDWALIERLSGATEHLWSFCDPAQTLWLGRSLPAEKLGPRYLLIRKYRCHETIQALASVYESTAADGPDELTLSLIAEGANKGRIAFVRGESRGALSGLLITEINRLLDGGLDRSDIVIVSLVSRTTQGAIASLGRLGRYRLVRADDERMGEEIVADSVFRFKGLERRAVILTDLSLRSPEEAAMRRAKMYVAITRARSFIRVVDTGKEVRGEPELAALLERLEAR